jgi:hypothetical protein
MSAPSIKTAIFGPHRAQNSNLYFAPIFEPGMSSDSGRDHDQWVSRGKYGHNAGREAPSTVDRSSGEGANSAHTIFILHRFTSQAKRLRIRAFRKWFKYLEFCTIATGDQALYKSLYDLLTIVIRFYIIGTANNGGSDAR